MPTAVIILMVLNWPSEEILTLIASAHTIGYFAYFLILFLYAYHKTHFRLSLLVWPDKSTILGLGEATVYPTLGLTVRQSLRIVERALASLIAPGGVAAYYFAFRLISSLQTIIGVSMATTRLPSMTRMVSEGNHHSFDQSFWKQFRQTALISLPITLIVLLFHNVIIQIFYGRGAFNQGSIDQTSQILQILGISIFFLSLTPTINAALYALQKYKLVWWNQIISTAINLILAWWLSNLFGIIGIAVALVIATFISVVVQMIMLRYSRGDLIPNEE